LRPADPSNANHCANVKVDGKKASDDAKAKKDEIKTDVKTTREKADDTKAEVKTEARAKSQAAVKASDKAKENANENSAVFGAKTETTIKQDNAADKNNLSSNGSAQSNTKVKASKH